MRAEKELNDMLTDPSVPYWVRDVIKTALDKDCVDVANALEHIAALFDRRVKELHS